MATFKLSLSLSLLILGLTAFGTTDARVIFGDVEEPEDTWQCSVCNHIYDPTKDGNGQPFPSLPDTWKCPVCGAPKSAYKQTLDANGNIQWVHGETDQKAKTPLDTWQCSVCNHVYDPAKDGNGQPFSSLPDTWKCPVCGAPKSAYKQTLDANGAIQWVHGETNQKAKAPLDTWQCSVCNHVYDPAKDGNGLAFPNLPDTWKCPVCGAPKSAYKQTLDANGNIQWVHQA